MSHPQTLQIPFPEFMLSAPTIQDSSQKLQLEHEKSQFSCNSHKKIVPLQPKSRSLVMTTISNATKSNWHRLNTSIEGRLTNRANKTLSAKKIIASNYIQTDKATTLLELVSSLDAPLEDIIYTLCVKRLETANILHKSNVQETLAPYQSYQYLNLNISHEIWDCNEDILGFILQSLLAEGERNKTGQYYTNKGIVKTMLNGLHIQPNETFYDPCCGSGAFLIGIETNHPENLYGTDLNPLAVLITKVNLLVKHPNRDFIPNISCADFLKCHDTLKHDYIYTNPPWGADRKNQYKVMGIHSKERASMFLVKAIKTLKVNGHLGFLLPTSLLKIQKHRDVRSYILKKTTIEYIELHNGRFDGVFTDYFSIKLHPTTTSHQAYSVKKDGSISQIEFTTLSEQTEIPIIEKKPIEESIKKKITEKANDYLTHSKWALGIVTGNNKEKLLLEQRGNAEPIFTGKEVESFVFSHEKKYIVFDPMNFQQCAKEEYFRAPEKLIYRFIANRPIVAYDNQQRLCLNSANILIPEIDTISTKTVAALLNSALYQYLYLNSFSDMKVLKSNLSTLPFPKLSHPEDSYLANIVDMILSHPTRHQELHSLIDDYVFDIFNISDLERNWIISHNIQHNILR